MMARVIATVADDYEALLLLLALIQLMQCVHNSVVQRGPAFGGIIPKGLGQHVRIVGESGPERQSMANPIVEVRDEDFVIRIAGVDECERGVDYFAALGLH